MTDGGQSRGQAPLPAPGHMGVDYEERVDFARLRDYRIGRARSAGNAGAPSSPGCNRA